MLGIFGTAGGRAGSRSAGATSTIPSGDPAANVNTAAFANCAAAFANCARRNAYAYA